MANFSESACYSHRFIDALSQVAEWHKFQIRKQNNIPYISHLMSVSALVMEANGDEDEAISALCHDAVEDVDSSIESIRELYGDRVAHIVAALSEDKSLPKEQRKSAYVDSIRKSDRSVALVSAADKLHNIYCYARNPELFKEEVVIFYSKLIPVYIEKLGENHRFVREIIKAWYILNNLEVEEVFISDKGGLRLTFADAANYRELSRLASRQDYELADRCEGSVFEALSPGEIVFLKEGIFRLDGDLNLVELAN